jgi:hypothetical protein
MSEDDLRDCFAMFRSIGGGTAEECFRFADMMLEARKQKENQNEETDGGIASVAKRTYKRKS